MSSAAQPATRSKSVGTKKARSKQKCATSTTPGQTSATDTINSVSSPLTVQTRRSSLRSSTSADGTLKSDRSPTVSPAEVKPLMGSPVRPDSGTLASPSTHRSAVPVLAQHVWQGVRYWSSKSTAVDVAAAMVKSQPCCSDVVDAVLQVLVSVVSTWSYCGLSVDIIIVFVYLLILVKTVYLFQPGLPLLCI